MRKSSTLVGLALFALSGSALAQEDPATGDAPAPSAAAAPEGGSGAAPASTERLTLGVDVAAQIPVSSAFRNRNAISLGGLVRVEVNLIPNLNLTLRGGYVYGFKHNDNNGVQNLDYKTSNIPIWVGGKYFFTDMIYGAAEVGYNRFKWSFAGTIVGQPSHNEGTDSKYGGTIGAGALFGALDVKAQLEVLNFGEMSNTMAVMINVGYDFLKLL